MTDLTPTDFRALFESAPGLYLVLLPDAPRYTIAGATDAYLRATLTERADIVGRPLFEVFPDNPASPEAGGRNMRASLERVLASGAPDVMAVQRHDVRRDRSGAFEECYWSPSNSALPGPAGKPGYLLHCVEDVTAFVRSRRGPGGGDVNRVEAEVLRRGRELQETNLLLRDANATLAAKGELQFRMLFDLMPQLGWTSRPDGFIDFYNRRWFEYTGMSPASQSGWGWESVHDPMMLPGIVERWKHSLQTGTPFEMEFPLRRADGVFRWFLTRVVPVRDVSGDIVRWVGINTDIHERKQANAASEETLRLFAASINDYAIFMLDAQGKVRTWNPGAERIKQYRAEEIIGKPFSIFYPREAVEAGHPARELEVAAREGRFEDEGFRVRKDGSPFWANVVISAMLDPGGRLLGFSKITRDLTERRRAEVERVGLARAEEAIRLRDEFLSIASHELKTPLASLLLLTSGLIRWVAKGPLDAIRLLGRVEKIDVQLSRLTKLVGGMLEVSRISAGRSPLKLEEVDLDRSLREVAERLQPDLAAAQCYLTLRSDGPLPGRWDRLHLDAIVTNLLSNALKYGAHHPVAATLTREGKAAVLTVLDHGIGIAAEDQQRIFERFARATSAEHYGGFGLGLWIAKQFVDELSGTIEVRSALGAGACFTVRLPLDARPS